MLIQMLKSKIHRATVTDADLQYEGSISIDRSLCEAAHLSQFEQVDVYNVNTGSRFTTYVIFGSEGQICLNGAAARLVQPGDLVIIASYCSLDISEAKNHKPSVVLVDPKNAIKQIKTEESHQYV